MKDLDHPQQENFADSSTSMSQFARRGALVTIATPVPYPVAWELQQRLHAERLSGGRADTLVLLQHLPVYTVGRRTKPEHLGQSMSPDIPIEASSRGGSITYHGPGQLVGYPVVAVSQHAPGPKTYIHMLEEVLIRTLACWSINGHRANKTPGIWTRSSAGEVKIASVGARIEQGISLHGFALNVDLDLSPFAAIVPCGLDRCRMTSMADILQTAVCIRMVGRRIAQNFSSVFQLEWTSPPFDFMTPAQCEQRPTLAAQAEA